MPEPSDPQSQPDEHIDDAELARIVDAPAPVPSPQAEEAFLEEKTDLDSESKRAHLKGVLQDIDERKKYALHILRIVVGWLGLMAYVMLAQGYNWSYFLLSDNVLIALVATTTGGVVGLLLVVVKYLFPAKGFGPPQPPN